MSEQFPMRAPIIRIRVSRLTSLLFALASVNVHAADQKIPVTIDCTVRPEDFVGQRVCSALRDALASSPRYSDGAGTEKHWKLYVISVPDDVVQGTVMSSAQAVSLTFETNADELYIQTWAYITGSSITKMRADAIFAAVDDEIHHFVK